MIPHLAQVMNCARIDVRDIVRGAEGCTGSTGSPSIGAAAGRVHGRCTAYRSMSSLLPDQNMFAAVRGLFQHSDGPLSKKADGHTAYETNSQLQFCYRDRSEH